MYKLPDPVSLINEFMPLDNNSRLLPKLAAPVKVVTPATLTLSKFV